MTAVIDYRTSGALEFLILDATAGGDETTEGGPVDELRLCALNVNSPNPSRAQRIVNLALRMTTPFL